MTVVWGIDCSTRGIAVGIAPAMDTRWAEFPLADRGSVRLGLAHLWTSQLAGSLAEEHRPTYVLIERPAGAYVSRQLTEVCGVVKAALWCSLRALAGHTTSVTVAEIQVSEWKREAVGHGGASKGRVMEWAVDQGYRGDRQDEADALAIARAGLLSIEDGVAL